MDNSNGPPAADADAEPFLRQLLSSAPTDPVLGYFDEERAILRRRIAELREAIAHRQHLKAQFLEQIDADASKTRVQLLRYKYVGAGYRWGMDQRKMHLERQLSDLSESQRRERLRYWEDMRTLREQLRVAEAEYSKLTRRLAMTG